MSLRASEGRIVIEVPMQRKNWHTFSNGMRIRLERGPENFNLREVNPVNAIVIASNLVPVGTEILIQYNAIQETFRMLNFKPLSGSQIAEEVNYYSIPEEMAYAYLDGQEWKPLKNYAFGLRVYRPYEGMLVGIEPKKIKDTLFVTTGELKGKIVRTLSACDYCIVFQDVNDQEGNIILFQHYEGEDNDNEQVVCIMDELTDLVHENKLLIGTTKSDAKTLKEHDSFRTSKDTKRIAF